jgi:hypothetical protein
MLQNETRKAINRDCEKDFPHSLLALSLNSREKAATIKSTEKFIVDCKAKKPTKSHELCKAKAENERKKKFSLPFCHLISAPRLFAQVC